LCGVACYSGSKKLRGIVVSLGINLFGEFRVRREETLLERREWGRQKTRSLLKLLLTRSGHAFSRDEILEALWPSTPPEAAERSLRVTVSLLRRALEPDLRRGPDSRYVLQRRPGYLFDCRADCWVDAWEFKERQSNAEAARKAGDLDEALDEYRAALGLVRGEFLAEEPYEEWAMEARREFKDRQLAVLSGLSECLALKGRYAEAIETCERALSLDSYGEDLHRRLMLYRYCAGEQALALQTYRSYATTLEEELDAQPSPGLTRLREQIEARDVPGVDELRRYPRPRRPLKFPYSLSRTQFAGRDEEYAWFVERLRETQEGRGGAVAVEGEAGVGKTRLVEEFLGYARSRDTQVLRGRCYERELGPPLEPVLDALDPAGGVAGMLPGLSDHREDELGYLRTSGSYEASRVYHALTRECIRRSCNGGEGGLILFVDDVQWADRATMDFLSYLAKRIHGEKVLLVFAYRREHAPELAKWLEQLADRRAVSTLSLNRLSPGDLGRILGRMSSRTFGGLPSLTSFLYRQSEGNPFYAVEYLRWLIEAGTVEIDSRRRISGLKGEALQENVLPSGVRTLIQARFGGLSEEAREVMELAAIIGRDFDPALLSNAGFREARVADLMESLMSSCLIVQNPAMDGMYYFSHDKLRQALYEDIGAARRRELHLRVAGALEKDGGEPAELAHHYLQAQEWRPALENLVRAAQKAEDSYAWNTASENYARALEVAGKLPGYEEKRFELLAARERFLEHMDRRQERATAVQEMFELADRMGDKALIAEACVRRIGVFMSLFDPKGAEEAGRAALAIFRELGDKAGEARAHRELGYVRWVNRDYAAALEANLQALWIHREMGHRRAEAGDAGNIAHVYRGMGDLDSAIRWNEEAIQIDRELEDKLGEGFRLNSMASINRERGDLKAALSLHIESLETTVELGAKNVQVPQHVNCGTMYLSLGDPEEALEHFRAAVRLSRETGYTRDEGYALMSVGAALEQTGDATGAAATYRRAIELLHRAYEESEISKELHGKADALTLLGTVLHRSLGCLDEARNAYEEAADIYRGLGGNRRLRKLLMNLAGLRWRLGDIEGSARDYEETLGLAREHGEAVHEAAALASLSVVYRDLGSLKESVRCGKEALELLRSLEDAQAEAYVLTSLAESYSRLGHHPSALSCLKRSLRLRREVGDLEGEIGARHDLASIYEKLGDTNKVRGTTEEAASK
jgi:DNA-binding SARP family transcriptional activator/predicted ATPase